MRLLNIHTLEFRVFPSDEKPRYAITSHRWIGEEITFQQFIRSKSDKSIRDVAGYKKILSFCQFMREWEDSEDIEWLWIDTCCINKESSTELSEAINSMFRWYAEAWVCLAYLHDVSPRLSHKFTAVFRFEHSEWFQRGWTLQELLAPPTVVFLDKHWDVFGYKTPTEPEHDGPQPVPDYDGSLIPQIASITHIDEGILRDYRKAKASTFAEARAWMGDRTCTRIEDEAYCLLGICGVYMPLIYGERDEALERLEEEFEKKNIKIRKKAVRDLENVQSLRTPKTYLRNVRSPEVKRITYYRPYRPQGRAAVRLPDALQVRESLHKDHAQRRVQVAVTESPWQEHSLDVDSLAFEIGRIEESEDVKRAVADQLIRLDRLERERHSDVHGAATPALSWAQKLARKAMAWSRVPSTSGSNGEPVDHAER